MVIVIAVTHGPSAPTWGACVSSPSPWLEQVIVLKVALQYGVPYRRKDEHDVLGVCRLREMGVDRLRWLPIELEERVQDEDLDGVRVVVRACATSIRTAGRRWVS